MMEENHKESRDENDGENHEEVDDVANASSDSLTDDSEDDEHSTSGQDNEFHLEGPLTDEEIQELIDEFLEVESKAAEAQEALEKESLAKVEGEVREELGQTLHGDDLEVAVSDEMVALVEQWEDELDELEKESAQLLEQLDGAGIELPSLYKWVESQAPNNCSTDAWKRRIHWVGSQPTGELVESKAVAEDYLQTNRPVRRRHGKLLEEGASGFLQKKLAADGSKEIVVEHSELEWSSLNKILSEGTTEGRTSFGSKNWASVYLASTPQQAAEMGLKFPGVDEVEEIDDIVGDSTDPFVAVAVANESELALSEEQKKNYKKVKEEEDANIDRKLQIHLKRKRHRRRRGQGAGQKEVFSADRVLKSDMAEPPSLFDSLAAMSKEKSIEDEEKMSDKENDDASQKLKTNMPEGSVTANNTDKGSSMTKDASLVLSEFDLPELTEPRGSKRLNEIEELNIENKRSRTVIIDSDDEVEVKDLDSMDKLEGHFDHKENTIEYEGGSLSSRRLNDKYLCTTCDRVAAEVKQHPLLKVIVCADCRCAMEAKMQAKYSECSECYCGWCGGSTDLVSCKSCENLFCTSCIKRNIGMEYLSEAQSSVWKCCCCCPSLLQNLTSQLEKSLGCQEFVISSSDSDSDNSDADIDALSSKRKQKKKIRRILDDAELGEETKRKIAIEKERQERLKSLQVQFSAKSKVKSSVGYNGNLSEGVTTEVLGDASTGYVVNVVREKGEEAVRIPSSISAKLKAHQITGIRFMWENIIQSIREVESGDKGLGCILAHTMGLGKTFQVIAFLYTAMRSVDIGLRTALIVTPVNVLHNWRQEFIKWRPSEVKPLRVFMLEDVKK